MLRVSRKTLIFATLVLALIAAVVVVAVIVSSGHKAEPSAQILGGNLIVGRAFAALEEETDVTCIDSSLRDPWTNRQVFYCTGTYKSGSKAPCRPTLWDGHTAAYPDRWVSATNNGMGQLTC